MAPHCERLSSAIIFGEMHVFRFELFQLTARLEARWALALPPALMHAITELTEQVSIMAHAFPFVAPLHAAAPFPTPASHHLVRPCRARRSESAIRSAPFLHALPHVRGFRSLR